MVRYLDSNETYFILLLAIFLLVKGWSSQSFSLLVRVAVPFLLFIALLSENRTAVAALALSVGVYLIFTNRKRRILTVVIIALIVLAPLLLFSSEFHSVRLAFAGLADPLSVGSVEWRLMVQEAALNEAIRTFWTGQGYGGYFNFVIPGLNNGKLVNLPPHNQFLELFLKVGILGPVLAFLCLATYAFRLLVKQANRELRFGYDMYTTILGIVVVSQFFYGLAYDFMPLFGFYVGCATILLQARTAEVSAFVTT